MRRAQSWFLVVSGSALACLLSGCGREEMTPPEALAVADTPSVRALPFRLTQVKTFGALPAGAAGICSGPDGGVIVAGEAEVAVLGRDGSALRRWTISQPATCVAFDGADNVLVGHARSVSVFGRQGNSRGSWGKAGRGEGEMWLVRGISVSGANVYVADAGNRCVHRFAADGDFIATLGRRDREAGIPGIVVPSGYLDCVTIEEDGVLVTNPGRWLVERYSGTGELKAAFGKRGLSAGQFPGCCNPTNIELLPGEPFLVAAADKSIPRVQVFSPNGEVMACTDADVFADDASGIDLARGVGLAFYALDTSRQTVVVLELEPAGPVAAAELEKSVRKP